MSAFSDLLDFLYEWLSFHWRQIAFSAVAIVIVYLAYKLVTRQIARLRDQQRLEENVAFSLTRILQWIAGLLVLVVVFAQFGIEIGIVAGLLALAGGTIIGFAAMNTLGNAIAGIILMTSRPFKIGDRIFFQGQFADVLSVDLIYTRMRTLDNVLISVPNQELLKSPIDNYEKRRRVRRSCSITAGYELDPKQVETALLEAASRVDGFLKDPKPYVWMTSFEDYAVEYTLYLFTNEIKRLREIDAKLRIAVLEACNRYKIDISTPKLLRSVD